MNSTFERKRDLIGGISFIVFVVVLIVGGFFLTRYLTSDTEKKKIVQNETNKLKKDKEKDFVYFENEDVISEEPEIVYKDVVINILGNDTINKILKNEMDNIRTSVKKISENELDPNREVLYDEYDIYYAKERNYASYESRKYLSLLVIDSEFNCYTGSEIKSLKSYVFSLEDGKEISHRSLIDKYNLTIDAIKEKVRNKLVEDGASFGEENQILIDDTLNLITLENSCIYINKSGKLVISVIVKTNQESYNDTIELN